MLARVVWTANTPKFKSLPSELCTTVGDRVPVLRVIAISRPLRPWPVLPRLRSHVVPGSNASCVPGPISRKLDNKLHSCALLRILDLQIWELGDAAEQYFEEPTVPRYPRACVNPDRHGGAVQQTYWSTDVIDYLA